MEPTKQLVDEPFWERVRRTREMSPEEKLLAGPRLYDRACEIMECGIRMQFPDADEEEVNRILLERLAIAERLNDCIGTKGLIP